MAVVPLLTDELQPENSAAVQYFLHWIDNSKIHQQGYDGRHNTAATKYISQAALSKKLTRERIEELLDKLIRNDERRPDAETILNDYLRPFAILLSIGCGDKISHFVDHPSLQDDALPFTTESPNFPKSARCDLYKEFRKKQWQFCPVKLKYNRNHRLESDYILPIVRKKKIGEGGSAILYKIIVDKDYNFLRPRQSTAALASCVNPNIFVLKTYRTPEARKYFETEESAFMKLRYGDTPPGNITEYYGSFIKDDTFNIILEYADWGTLDEYMNSTHEPTDIDSTMTFWKSFLLIFNGLSHIHGTKGLSPNSGSLGSLLGWHHDISPDNILVVSRKGGSPYECDFKIADLGLSHFKLHSSSSGDATAEDKYGSNAYGAPEAHRSPDSEQSQRLHLQVPQSADSWSMGCVLSEVITWATEGHRKLREYRRRRRLEVNKTLLTREDRFHHNGEDYFTRPIVELLLHGSIIIDHKARLSAYQLWHRSDNILKMAQQNLDRGRSVPDGALDRKKRLPPYLPPRSASTSSAGTFEVETESWHRPRSTDFQRRDTHKEWVPNALIRKPVHNFMDFTDPLERSQRGHQQPDSAHRRQERVSSQPNSSNVQRQQYARSPAHKPHNEMWSRHNPLGIIPDTYDTTQAPSSPSRPRQNKHSPTSAGGPTPRPSTTGNTSRQSRFSDSGPFVERGVASSDLLSEASDIDEEPSSCYRPAPKNRPHPQMSVKQGLTIKMARECGRDVEYHQQALFRTSDAVLRNRDHAFLIDNAESMKPYRDQVRNVLELLSSLASGYDPDRLDLFFSTESRKHEPKDNEQMLRYFDERPAHGVPDMRERFAAILEPYQARFGKRNFLKRLLHFSSTPTKGPRRLTLYVLTDAVWQPECNLVTEIKRLVSLLQEYKMPNKHIGIQFIRFGNDPEGKKRLQTLDSGLGLDLDIIDTTPADGNVWKMLLGSVNDWFDDDHDDSTDHEREP